ncbi:leucyl/phenylalanyl-tRNA--protein transferase [Dokdonella sp.]|uniref:leucyl/phenylalanyl-tRNA--protein transferase n=1 Tax=Dokdonella sp. TaxID=2291710 RepID=UPI00352847BD
MIRLPQLRTGDLSFPAAESALEEPNGLLAFGGDLSVERLIEAYAHGIFPWYSEGQPILWWSPDPRMVIATASPHVPRRLGRWIRSCTWKISIDTSFDEVVRHCAAPRHHGDGTWITDDMLEAYIRLHRKGYAHSLEIRDGDGLVGGIYGVAIGRMFFGESMFSLRSNASKLALLSLCKILSEKGFSLLDAQVSSDHLETLGAFEIGRDDFNRRIASLIAQPGRVGRWTDWADGLVAREFLRGATAAGDLPEGTRSTPTAES